MRRSAALAGLLIALLTSLTPVPAGAGGPTLLDVRNPKTGMVTRLAFDPFHQVRFEAFGEFTGVPWRPRHEVRPFTGHATVVAVLTWRGADGSLAWRDRVVEDGTGQAWVAHVWDPSTRYWFKLRRPAAFRVLLAGLEPSPMPAQSANRPIAPAINSDAGENERPSGTWRPLLLGAVAGVALGALLAAATRRPRRDSLPLVVLAPEPDAAESKELVEVP